VGRLIVSLLLALLLFGRTLSYDLIHPVEFTAQWWKPTGLVDATLALGAMVGGDWGHRLLQVLLLGLLAWVASGAVPRGIRRTLVLLGVLFHPMMLASVMDPTERAQLLVALFGTLAITRTGLWAGLWSLLAVAAHPIGSIVPLLGLSVSRRASASRRIPWRLGAVVAWWGSRLALEGRTAVELGSGWAELLGSSGALAGHMALQLILPLHPVYSRMLPSFTPAELGLAWAGWAAAIALAVWLGRRPDAPGPGLLSGMAVVTVVLLLSCGVGEGALVYSEACLVWPVVGLAWMLVALPPVRVAAWAFVPLWLGVSGVRSGDYRDPLLLWQHAHQIVPQDASVRLALGHALVDTEPEQAAVLLEGVMEDVHEAGQRLQIRRSLVGAYIALGRAQDARPHLAQLADPAVPDPHGDLRLRCTLASRLGDVIWDEERASITAVCKAAVSRAPDDVALLFAAAMVEMDAGTLEDARAYILRAVALAPEQNHLRQMLANLPWPDGDWDGSGAASQTPAP